MPLALVELVTLQLSFVASCTLFAAVKLDVGTNSVTSQLLCYSSEEDISSNSALALNSPLHGADIFWQRR